MTQDEQEPTGQEPTGHDLTQHDLTEHDPVESARPSIGRRDEPDAIRPDPDDRPHRTLPPREEGDATASGDSASDGTASDGAPDAPRPTESPAGRD